MKNLQRKWREYDRLFVETDSPQLPGEAEQTAEPPPQPLRVHEQPLPDTDLVAGIRNGLIGGALLWIVLILAVWLF